MNGITNKRLLWSGLLAVAVLLVVLLPREASAEPKANETPARQKLVRVRVDGGTFLLTGDALIGTDKSLDGGALTYLQQQGYRIISVHMTASAGVNPEQQAALIWLEKKE